MNAAKAVFKPSASTNLTHASFELVSAKSSVLIAATRATEACFAIFFERSTRSISSKPSHSKNASRFAGDESNAQSASKTFSSHSSSASSAGSRDLNGARHVSTASMPPSPPRSCFTPSPPVCARIASTSAAYARTSSASPARVSAPTFCLPLETFVARRRIHRGSAPSRALASSVACSGSISSRFSTTPSAWCTAAASSGTSRSRFAKRSSDWSRSSYPLSFANERASATPPSSCDSTESASKSSCRSSSACAATSELSCASKPRMEGTALSRTNSGYSSG
mmetsp:Transcript_8601/g.36405  ORF Transcript_8601/g.36405 Transcript_8601/m.36405 type:complete len:282 (-) Transcript_8601:664-1509(-)